MQTVFIALVSTQAIHVEDGSFSWDIDEKPTLQK